MENNINEYQDKENLDNLDQSKNKFLFIEKNTIIGLTKNVRITKLKKIKNKKTKSDAQKLQLLESLTLNQFDLNNTLLALGLNELDVLQWLAEDNNFKKLLRQYFSNFRYLLYIRMMDKVDTGGYKLRECELLLSKLPELKEQIEDDTPQDDFIALVPFLLSKDAENLGKGIINIDKDVEQKSLNCN